METCRLPVSLTGGRPLPLPTGAVPGTDAVGGYLFWLGYVMVCPSSSLSFSKLGDSVFTFFVFPIILIIHHKLDDNYWQSNKYNPLIQLGMKLDLWVQQHREYRVWQKNIKKKKTKPEQTKKQTRKPKPRKKQEKKSNKNQNLHFPQFFFLLLFFSFFCVFFVFFLFLLVILPVDLFFGDSVFVFVFVFLFFFAKIHFLCSTRGHKVRHH